MFSLCRFNLDFKITLLLTLWLVSSQVNAIAANIPATPDTLPAYSTGFDPQRNAFNDGLAAIKLAQATQRRILIELGGNWCTWCHIMDEFFANNPDIKHKLHQTFVMLKVNVSNRNDNAEFLKAFPKPLGYPHMYVTEPDGSILWSQDTGEFLVNGEYNRQAFLDFFNRWHISKQIAQ